MGSQLTLERYLVLYLPWGLALALQFDPGLSYMVAWLGSFFIFFITLSGWVKPLPKDRPWYEQLMRPLFLIQVIFAGYMACTSIFYFLSLQGYENFTRVSSYFFIDQNKLALAAQCQRYYCLAHAALVTGILAFMKYPTRHKYYVEKTGIANLLLVIALIAFPVSELFLRVPGLSQFSAQLSPLSFIAGTLALAFAIPLKKVVNTVICVCLYLFNFYQAFISGFKEPIIISVLVLGIFLYPSYKKAVTFTIVPLLFALFLFLPTFNHVFRQANWSDNVDAETASQAALDAALNASDNDQDNTNWNFFVYRLSEIDMFTTFVSSTPAVINFYGFSLLKQSAIAIIPRVFWPSKPITEDMVMERVYNAGVVYRASHVSAKPAFVVDAYLSGGTLGIFVCLFIYGAVAQLISIKAEQLFGGYILGSALIFAGLFQIMWRGLSFEFLINSVFWSFISMFIIFKLLRITKVLKSV